MVRPRLYPDLCTISLQLTRRQLAYVAARAGHCGVSRSEVVRAVLNLAMAAHLPGLHDISPLPTDDEIK